jgi:hypothetical protein
MVGGRGKTCWAGSAGASATTSPRRRRCRGAAPRGELAQARQQVLAFAADAGGAEFVLEQRLGLFDHHQGFDLGGELAHLGQRRRVAEAELEHRRVGEGLAHVHVGRAGGDEADAPVAARLEAVEGEASASAARAASRSNISGRRGLALPGTITQRRGSLVKPPGSWVSGADSSTRP